MDNQQKGILSIRNLLKILSFLCMIFYFCPSFLVSCGGQKLEVAGSDVTVGLSASTGFGSEKISDPHLAVIICLFIPIAIFVISFIVKRSTGLSIALAVLALVDLITWFVVRSGVKSAAKKNGCGFETTGVFVFTVIFLILILAAGIMGLVMKVNLAADVRYAFSGVAAPSGGVRSVSHAHARPVGGGQVVGYCENCGSPIHAGKKFCTSCGTPVSEEPVAAPEPAPAINRFCPYCGAKLEEDSAFCTTCGKKLEIMRL